MNDSLAKIVQDVAQPPSLPFLAALFLGVGITFGILEQIFPASRRRILRPGMGLDLVYWLFTPLITKSMTSIVIVAAAYSVFAIMGWSITAETMDGFGPIAAQAIWLQIVEALVLADFIGYWTHRFFHESRLWRFHAVHHSPQVLDWLSAYRMHPLNDAASRLAQALPLLLIGFPPRVIVGYVPFIVVYVVFLHSNVSWTFGPFRYLLASPTFHRWHHTSEAEGIDRNYATIFPLWDLLFGTFYLPDRQPAQYGVKDNSVPESFFGQMLHPFVWCNRESGPKRNECAAANLVRWTPDGH